MKILISEAIQELDEKTIEKMIWDEEDKVKISGLKLKWRIMKSLDMKAFWYRRTLRTACLIILVSALVPFTTKAAINYVLTHSALIDDTNRDLIGTEIIVDNYIVYKDGTYLNAEGEVIDLEKMRKEAEGIPDNRIINEISIDNYSPSSIIEVVLEGIDDSTYATPELIMTNNSACILTKEDGTGWYLEDGDTLEYSFEKYKSKVVAQQNLLIGYIKDGVMFEGQGYRDLTGNYTLVAEGSGEYFIYVLSASSDYLALKEGRLEENSK